MSNIKTRTHLRPAAIAIAAGVAFALAGCQTDTNFEAPTASFAPTNASERFPIAVTETSVSMEIPVRKRMSRLPANVRADVQNFLSQYSSSGAGHLVIITPRRARYATSMAVAMSEVQRMIKSSGVNPGGVIYANYPQGAAGTTAPITLSFEGSVAIGPDCGNWSENLAANYQNTPFPNFGCAQQHNIAAMVDNPNDLVTPRTMTPKHAGRGDVVIENYRVGTGTEADTSAATENTVSEVAE